MANGEFAISWRVLKSNARRPPVFVPDVATVSPM